MTDGNLTLKCGFITWAMWIIAGVLILTDVIQILLGLHPAIGMLGMLGVFVVAGAAAWTACACMRTVGNQLLAEMVRVRKERAERDRVHVLQ